MGIITITGTFTDTLSTNLVLALTAEVTTPTPEESVANNTARLLLGSCSGVYLPLVQR
jgi:hypothetical protein